MKRKIHAAHKENKLSFEEITVNLAHLEEDAGNYADAIDGFRPPRKFRRSRMRCNSRLTQSKENGGEPMLRRPPLMPPIDRAIALCFSRAALV